MTTFNKNLQIKKEIINNTNRQEPEPYTPNQTAYIKSKAGNYAHPKFIKSYFHLEKISYTTSGTYHKKKQTNYKLINKIFPYSPVYKVESPLKTLFIIVIDS
jgi:hypothetical protein